MQTIFLKKKKSPANNISYNTGMSQMIAKFKNETSWSKRV